MVIVKSSLKLFGFWFLVSGFWFELVPSLLRGNAYGSFKLMYALRSIRTVLELTEMNKLLYILHTLSSIIVYII